VYPGKEIFRIAEVEIKSNISPLPPKESLLFEEKISNKGKGKK
jgi:hypothetical protein